MIDTAIKSVQRTLRDYISIEQEYNVYVYTKILSHLINTWAEVRILKLIYEHDAFQQTEISSILNCNTLEEKWTMALNYAFMKSYSISDINKILDISTPYTPRTRYMALIDIIHNELLESYQVRNRIAHGQWKYAFNKELTGINSDLTRKIRTENILMLQYKLSMFKSLAQIIHDLAISKPTFERDFDTNYNNIERQKKYYHNHDYQDYVKKRVEKKKRGIARRKANIRAKNSR